LVLLDKTSSRLRYPKTENIAQTYVAKKRSSHRQAGGRLPLGRRTEESVCPTYAPTQPLKYRARGQAQEQRRTTPEESVVRLADKATSCLLVRAQKKKGNCEGSKHGNATSFEHNRRGEKQVTFPMPETHLFRGRLRKLATTTGRCPRKKSNEPFLWRIKPTGSVPRNHRRGLTAESSRRSAPAKDAPEGRKTAPRLFRLRKQGRLPPQKVSRTSLPGTREGSPTCKGHPATDTKKPNLPTRAPFDTRDALTSGRAAWIRPHVAADRKCWTTTKNRNQASRPIPRASSSSADYRVLGDRVAP